MFLAAGLDAVSVTLSNDYCKVYTASQKVCNSYSDSNYIGDLWGVSGQQFTLQPFTTYKIYLGSLNIANTKISLPLDVETTLNYGVYSDHHYLNKLFIFTVNTDDNVYIPLNQSSTSSIAR